MNFILRGFNSLVKSRLIFWLLLFFLLLYLFYFSGTDTTNTETEQLSENLHALPKLSFTEQVKPILDRRCVVCHSCYDAPCQLKLSSVEGIRRGASHKKLYNPRRLLAIPPTRLFIDAKNEAQWREKGFFSVLMDTARHSDNNSQSLLSLILKLKQQHPQSKQGKLAETFTLGLNREQQCTEPESFEDFAANHPDWGMPYAMPNLAQSEYNIIMSWLSNGAVMPAAKKIPIKTLPQITKWENFLNQSSNKQRLISRYLYEHLFHAHIHFKGTSDNEFYRLVRSTTRNSAIDEIATLRPYDDPGINKFYYRLRLYTPTIIAKSHIVYEFSEQRMQRYKKLFVKPDYKVEQFPSYSNENAANPFKVFAVIPPDSRYRFLLDEARFFIEGFIKGPVCRGQIALNVIEDRFWVVFFNPDQKIFTTQPDFLNHMSDYLRIPSERKSHANLLAIWTDYWQRQKRYMSTKQIYFENIHSHDIRHAMNYIWNGNQTNPNAALTVFRNFDSASVKYGFVGAEPETTWIIDYPLLERIHYLLVAGFNVYGNVVHQLSTRIYMDFLRMEGEDHFLAFLPANKRKKIRDQWYQGIRSELDELFTAPMEWLNVKSVTGYTTDDVQAELYQNLKQRMGSLLEDDLRINQCGKKICSSLPEVSPGKLIDAQIKKLEQIKGVKLHLFPEVSFVRVLTDNPDASYSYTILRNKAYKNVTSMFSDERERDRQDIDKDTLTVLGWLSGNYPNFFFQVHERDLLKFVEHCNSVVKQQDFDTLIEYFGVRRTNSSFWKTADWFQDRYKQQNPLYSGLLDLSRYRNL